MTDAALASAFLEANPAHTGGSNGTVTRVVIHGTVSPCERGGARANARYFQRADAGGAAHYVVDPGESVQCVAEDRVAHHAPPNAGSVGIELTDPQGDTERFGPEADDPARWGDADHEAMLEQAAALTRDVCDRHGVPLEWLSVDDLKAGAHGITSHANVAKAWRKSDHTDPGGDFPVDHFMALVTGASSSEDDELDKRQDMLLQNASDKADLAVERASWALGIDPKDGKPTGKGVMGIEKRLDKIEATLAKIAAKVGT